MLGDIVGQKLDIVITESHDLVVDSIAKKLSRLSDGKNNWVLFVSADGGY